jgi:hypothetical protein
MRTVLLIGSALAVAGCATTQRYAPDSPRAWLPKAVPRATTIIQAKKYDPTEFGTLRYSLDLNGCSATLATEGYTLVSAASRRAGTTRYRFDLSRVRAASDSNRVRLMSSDASTFVVSGAGGGVDGSRGNPNAWTFDVGARYILGPTHDSFNHDIGPHFRPGLNPGDPSGGASAQTGEVTRFGFRTKSAEDASRIASGLNILAAECAAMARGSGQ